MRLIVDKETKPIIMRLCDLALKAHGIAAFKLVADVASSMEDFSEGGVNEPEPTNGPEH